MCFLWSVLLDNADTQNVDVFSRLCDVLNDLDFGSLLKILEKWSFFFVRKVLDSLVNKILLHALSTG